MKKVTINGIMYVGDLKEKDGKATLSNAHRVDGGMHKGIFANYLKAMNSDALEAITFGGQGVSYSISELNDTEKMELSMAKIAMEQAKKVAIPGLENDTFDDILGK